MIEWIIWLWAFLCPDSNHTPENHGSCNLVHITTVLNAEGDTGGETGGNPPPPPPPPPPGS